MHFAWPQPQLPEMEVGWRSRPPRRISSRGSPGARVVQGRTKNKAICTTKELKNFEKYYYHTHLTHPNNVFQKFSHSNHPPSTHQPRGRHPWETQVPCSWILANKCGKRVLAVSPLESVPIADLHAAGGPPHCHHGHGICGAANGSHPPQWRGEGDRPRSQQNPCGHQKNSWQSRGCLNIWGWSSHLEVQPHTPKMEKTGAVDGIACVPRETWIKRQRERKHRPYKRIQDRFQHSEFYGSDLKDWSYSSTYIDHIYVSICL